MPKSKKRKGRGNGDAYGKAYWRGIEDAVLVALSDLLPDGPEKTEDGGDICPACSLEKRELTGLATLAAEVFHVEAAPKRRTLHAVGGGR